MLSEREIFELLLRQSSDPPGELGFAKTTQSKDASIMHSFTPFVKSPVLGILQLVLEKLL